MAHDFSYNQPVISSADDSISWPADASEFIFDSPQPTPRPLPDHSSAASSNPTPTKARLPLKAPRATTAPHQAASASSPSSASGNSSHASSDNQLHYTSPTPSPPFASFVMASNTDSPSGDYNPFMDLDDTQYAFDDSTFPMGEQGMNDLSLNNLDHQTFTTGPDTSGLFQDPSLHSNGNRANNHASPLSPSSDSHAHLAHVQPQRMTVQPSKMFQVGSREDSPSSVTLGNSLEGSPAPLYHNSPLSGNDGFTKAPQANYSNLGLSLDRPGLQFQNAAQVAEPSSASPNLQSKKPAATNWPCRLTVDQTPDKSRVETQIPIKLTLYDCPPGITKLHLPTHTISKPKFQAKPPHQSADDTLELTTMLVCASAMQKDGVEQSALHRALSDEIPVKTEDPANPNADDNDPDRPLNGGPVAICPGCIVRERKRAARKKTKKVDEEEEWAKDEAKRVIVFNCAEVRDWCVPGTKETPVKDHDGNLDQIFVSAPMRIACYCRHQSEKIGFQVIFTIKTHDGRVLAQAMSNSIMITDDHKQPVQHSAASSTTGFGSATNMHSAGSFNPAYMVSRGNTSLPTFQDTMPFRTSFSTNDLASMQRFSHQHHQYMQMQQASFPRGYQNGRSQTSTASATPRNLSRPASPTDPTGQPSKKRRSAGLGSKIPSGLTMTRLDPSESPSSMGPRSGGIPSGGFTFPPNASQYASSIDAFGSSGMSNNAYPSGPSTPHGGSMSGYGSPGPMDGADPYGYYSAPTSQHPSRAPSPNPLSRTSTQLFPQVPQLAAEQLSKITAMLPAGLQMNRPPIIQRMIPPSGPQQGGDEVTILGSGFFQGLEVMFGDVPATNTVFWGDTTLVCRAPPSSTPGPVAVMFEHQHGLHTAPAELQQTVQQVSKDLMPTRVVSYSYMASESQAASFARQQQQQQQIGAIDPSQLNQDILTNRFLQQQTLQNQGFATFMAQGATQASGASGIPKPQKTEQHGHR